MDRVWEAPRGLVPGDGRWPKPAGAGDRYDIAFMDPPYGYDLVGPTLAQLVKGNWLKPDALIVAETSKDEAVPEMDGYELMDSRDYGAARVLFLRRI